MQIRMQFMVYNSKAIHLCWFINLRLGLSLYRIFKFELSELGHFLLRSTEIFGPIIESRLFLSP